MDHLFKKNLRFLKDKSFNHTFSDDLFDASFEFLESEISKKDKEQITPKQVEIVHLVEQFAKKNIHKDTSVLEIPGGEVVFKKNISKNFFDSLKLPRQISERFLKGKAKNQVKIIFLAEFFEINEQNESVLSDPFLSQLIWCFPLSTAELFRKMILAMKLNAGEFILYPFEYEGDSLKDDIYQISENYHVKIIVTLGAKATKTMLDKSDRLTQIHGEFFNLKTDNEHHFDLVPLFHPSIIETNQNMKKTAWVDMQKIMKFMENLS
jgi:DNA polymerase